MDDCDLYSDEAWIGSASLPEWDSVRVIVPAGPIQIRFHVEDQARTVDVVAAVGRECHVTLKK
jgi:hypothetical protein